MARVDDSKRPLGKLAPITDWRTLKMEKYLRLAIPDIPPAHNWGKGVYPWGLFGNDMIGDCTCAAAAHAIQLWTQHTQGEDIILPTDKVIEAYSAISGYDPDDLRSDRGAVVLHVLKYWRKTGIGGHKIEAFVGLRERDHSDLRAAIYLFGCAYVGLALPKAAQSQEIWRKVGPRCLKMNRPHSWGGHAVIIVAYNETHLRCVTWGGIKDMTWGWLDRYLDESYALLSPDWVTETSPSPLGFDVAALRKDLKSISE